MKLKDSKLQAFTNPINYFHLEIAFELEWALAHFINCTRVLWALAQLLPRTLCLNLFVGLKPKEFYCNCIPSPEGEGN